MEIDTTKLMKLRIAKNLSQYNIAENTGLSKSTINRIESGRYKNPKYQTLLLICQELDVSMLSILKGEY